MEEAAPAAESSAPVTENIPSVGGGEVPAPSSNHDSPLLGGTPTSASTVNDTTPDAPSETKLWHETLPEQFRENKNISKYNSLEDMLNGHVNLSKKIGEKSLEMPGEDASTADWDKFYARVGRPESVDGYSEFAPEMILDSEGNEVPAFEFDKAQLSEAQKRLHAKGLNDSQMQEVMSIYSDITSNAQTDIQGQMAQEASNTESELRREYGDKFDAKMKSVTAIAETLGIKDTLIQSGLGNNLAVIRMIDSLGAKIGESTITGDASASGGGFDQRLAALKAHPAAKSKGHPEYQGIQNQIQKLYREKYGE